MLLINKILFLYYQGQIQDLVDYFIFWFVFFFLEKLVWLELDEMCQAFCRVCDL